MTIIRDLIDWPETEPTVTPDGVLIVCARCRREFTLQSHPDGPAPAYCGETCRRKARRARKKRRDGLKVNELTAGTYCPHPTKARFRTEQAAESARLYWFPRNAAMETYQCRCGSWHIGHGRSVS